MQRRASLFLWRGRALVVGPGIDSTPHAHYAVQLTLGLERPFRARFDTGQSWVETDAAIFAPNRPHQIDCGGSMLAHLFVELPQQQLAVDSTVSRYAEQPDFVPVMAALRDAAEGRLDHDGAAVATQRWLDCALPHALAPASPECRVDGRIGKAIAWIDAHPGAEPDGATLASLACLSASRFTHLFREQTGLSLSRYLLWNRLLNAVAAVADGDNVTGAAHRAGFADLAHMSRTFKNTFGVSPSELHKMTIAFKRPGE